jgi:hypothetical protein
MPTLFANTSDGEINSSLVTGPWDAILERASRLRFAGVIAKGMPSALAAGDSPAAKVLGTPPHSRHSTLNSTMRINWHHGLCMQRDSPETTCHTESSHHYATPHDYFGNHVCGRCCIANKVDRASRSGWSTAGTSRTLY